MHVPRGAEDKVRQMRVGEVYVEKYGYTQGLPECSPSYLGTDERAHKSAASVLCRPTSAAEPDSFALHWDCFADLLPQHDLWGNQVKINAKVCDTFAVRPTHVAKSSAWILFYVFIGSGNRGFAPRYLATKMSLDGPVHV